MKFSKLFLAFFLGVFTVSAQTYMPDDNFETWCENSGYGDSIPNNDTISSFAASFPTLLAIDNVGISDLTGLEAFVSLTNLNCARNQLSNIDISFFGNQLTIFNATNNNADLYCITVFDTAYAANQIGFFQDSITSYSTDCDTAFGCMDPLSCYFSTTYSIDTVSGVNGSCFYEVTSYDTVDVCDSYLFGGIIRTVSGSYTNVLQTVDGCDSNVVLSLSIRNSTESYDTTTVLHCDNYIWNNLIIDVSGDYSFYYGLNNAGCDSTAYLAATIVYSNSGSSSVTACDTYTWDGAAYTSTGTYTNTYTNVAGCDSIHTLNLTINNSYSTVDTHVACNSFTWINGITYTTTNNTADSLFVSIEGCDSMVTLNLTISNSVSSFNAFTDCDSYTWINGITYDTSGLYIYNSITSEGCTSVDSLDLTINYSNTGVDTQVACDSYVWLDGNGMTYTSSNNNATHILTNSVGCDSVVTLNLTVNYSTSGSLDTTVCSVYTNPLGNNLDTTAIYTFVLTNAAGCDSVVTLNLTVNYPDSSFISISDCDSFDWNGITYTTTDTYYFSTQTVLGCDSVAVLDLFVGYNEIYTTTVTTCDNYAWVDANGDTITTDLNSNVALSGLYPGNYGLDGYYIDTVFYTNKGGCDSVEVLNLTITSSAISSSQAIDIYACDEWTGPDNVSYTNDGLAYVVIGTTVDGCDSVQPFNINIAPEKSSITSIEECDSYTWIVASDTSASSLYDTTVYISSGVYAKVYFVEHTFFGDSSITCDSIAYLYLTINPSTTSISNVNECNSYLWNGTIYDTSGVYTFATTNSNGCDSTATLNLTINYSADTFIDVITACDSYTWIDGITYSVPVNASSPFTNTTATHMLQTVDGCDSLIMLDLIIYPSYSDTLATETYCNSHDWSIDSLHSYGNITSSGVYAIIFESINGCDSLILLDVIINYSASSFTASTYCDSYTWIDGITYNTSGLYIYNSFTSEGCTRVDSLDLTINYSNTTSSSVTICDSYTWNGSLSDAISDSTYTSSGVFTNTYTNSVGCDSMHTLNLTINSSNTGSTSLTACDTYSWDGVEYTTTDAYTNTYTNVAGCDSVHTLNLTIDNTVVNRDTVISCYDYDWIPLLYPDSFSNVWGFDTSSTLLGLNNTLTYTVLGNSINSSVCIDTSFLYLTINPIEDGSLAVVACDSYLWEGNVYTSSGIYVDTIDGTLCDSVATLILTINSSNLTTDFVGTHCDEFIWIDGNTYTQTNNTSTHILTNVSGCDSVITLDLIIINSTLSNVSVTTCASYYWDVSDTTYTTSGIHSHTIENGNSVGCDSTIWLTLTIGDSWSGPANIVECLSYDWQGVTYTNDTVVMDTLSTINGCDSIVTLNLTIYNNTSTIDSQLQCDSYTWIDGNTYTESNNTANITLTDALGCDSIVTLNLTINSSSSSTDVHDACDSFVWFCDGNTYTTSNNTAFYTYSNAAGCDSTVTLDLTINSNSSSTDSHVACSSFTWIDGVTYTASNSTATYILTNALGCDSVITLDLIINDNLVVSISSSNNNLSALVTGGTSPYSYLWTGPIISSNATITPIVSGDYCVEVTDAEGCVSSQVCENVIISVINDLSVSEFNIYPNPTSGFVTLDFYASIKGNYSVSIFSSNGEQVYEDKILDFNGDYTKNINLSKLAKGNYIIQIHSDNQVVYRKILLQ